MPTPTRHRASVVKLPAKPDKAVIDDHRVRPDRHQPAAVPAVRETPERDAEQSVEDAKAVP
jgi:hypothetical protein